MNDERQTKFSNQILYNLFKDYTTEDIKILCSISNRLLSRYKAITNKECGDIEANILEIGISLDFIKQYKGNKRLSIKEISEIMKKISSFGVQVLEDGVHTRITIINKVQYDEKFKSFKILFNENVIEYLLLVEDKFTLLDLNIVKDLKSKYELGLYILVQMYKTTGLCKRKIEDLKDYFNTGGSTNDLMKYMRDARMKLNQNNKLNIKEFEFETSHKRIDVVLIKFKIM